MRHTHLLHAGLLAAVAGAAACADAPPPGAGALPPGASAFQAEPVPAADALAATDTLARSGEQVFAIGDGVPRYGFTPALDTAGTVSRIEVRPLGARGATQTLAAPDNLLGGDSPAERLFVADINFDGLGDLQLVTDRGAANTISAYWVFGGGDRRFHFVDELPTLQVDSARREVTSYHRAGHAGRIFTASRFRWEGRRLVETARESQDAIDGTTTYVFTADSIQRGRLVETRRDTLPEEQARTGPSWWEESAAP